MHDEIDAGQRAGETVLIAHIAYEETYAVVIAVQLGHFPLLHFVARIDDEPAGIVVRQGQGYECVAKRAGSASDQ